MQASATAGAKGVLKPDVQTIVADFRFVGNTERQSRTAFIAERAGFNFIVPREGEG